MTLNFAAFLGQLLLCSFMLYACSIPDDWIDDTRYVALQFSHDNGNLFPFEQSEYVGPGEVQLSLTAVFNTHPQIHTIYDENSYLVGSIDVSLPDCKIVKSIEIPENYFIANYPPQIFSINPCGVLKKKKITVNVSHVELRQSENLIRKNYDALRIYPKIPDEVVPELEISLQFRPRPGLFY